VQDFDPAVQHAIHRQQSIEQTAGLIAAARRAGFRTVNVDLVYGLPQQSRDTLAHTLDAVIEMAPDRVAWFGYAHLPHLRPHQKLVERSGPLPDTAARAALLALGLERLAAAGYERVGFDHFARPGDALAEAARAGRLHRNFQGYVVPRADHLLAFGATGISDSGRAYWQNEPDPERWAERVRAGELPVARGVALDDDDRLRGHVIRRLLCDGELDWADVDRRFGVRFEDYFAAELARLEGAEQRPLVAVDRAARRLEATPLGCNLIRNTAMVFDRYLTAHDGGARPRFSPTL
jgi:oxygen-independent coproporphyrinogen-3 oxidase